MIRHLTVICALCFSNVSLAQWWGCVPQQNLCYNDIITCCHIDNNSSEYFGGNFMEIGTFARDRIAFNGQTMGLGFNDTVFSITKFQGSVIAGGRFRRSGSNAMDMKYVAKWTGSSWMSIGDSLNAPVLVVIEYNDTLLAGTASGVYKWIGYTWRPYLSTNGRVNAMYIQAGELYAGGAFSEVNGIQVRNIFKFNASTRVIDDLSDGVPNEVLTIDSYYTKVFVGCRSSVNTAEGVFLYTGSNWDIPGDGLNGAVYDMVQSGGKLFATGMFLTSGNIVLNGVGYFDGISWHAMGGGINDLQSGMHGRVIFTYGQQISICGKFNKVSNIVAKNYAAYDISAVNREVLSEPDLDIIVSEGMLKIRSRTAAKCILSDVLGRTLYFSMLAEGDNDVQVTVPPGMYLITIAGDKVFKVFLN